MKTLDAMPVFDRRNLIATGLSPIGEWNPPRVSTNVKGARVAMSDGPTIEWRLAAQAARLTSNMYSGQVANDNSDWPLGKLLRTERLEYQLRLAERYRDLYDLATAPLQLRGTVAADLYLVHHEDKAGRAKAVKVITGRKADVDLPPTRKILPGDGMKKLAAPVPKAWKGDWPLLAKIDAKRELAILRARLAYVPKIIDAFEWAVVDGLTLSEIGKRLGAGSKGGKGEARARVFDGLDICDRYWRREDRKTA